MCKHTESGGGGGGGGGEGRGGEGAYFHRNFEMLAKSKKN